MFNACCRFSDASTKITGTADMLFVNAPKMKELWALGTSPPPTTLHLILYDWKRSKKKLASDYNPFEQALWPLHHLMNTSLNKYALQQNLYKYLLETFYAPVTWQGHTYAQLHIDEMNLAVLHPDHSQPERVLCPDLQEEVRSMLALRAQQIAGHRVYPLDKTLVPPAVGRPRGFGRRSSTKPSAAILDLSALDAL